MMVYLLSITMWALFKAVHEILLLWDCREEISLTVAIAGLQFQGLAVGSGWMVAMGASEVFVAQVEAFQENMPCQCYYTLEPLTAFFLMSTPLLLLYTYLCKAKRVAQAILSGDYMHTKTFEVRYDMLKLNEAWGSHDLLLPVPVGHSQQSCPRQFPIWKERALLLSALSILNRFPIRLLTVWVPAGLASAMVLPKLMI
ncbi:Peptide deformylase [Durusdinium trenchii]|uniref:Peptide deformylase n=1 Tax=Durusdinium trenchii TaxID=1381693 RepID=A0ABP0LBF2_9DINO